MKKVFLMSIIIILAFQIWLVFRNTDDSPRFSIHHPSHIDGKVIEIIDDNNVVVEITGNHDGFDIGDKVLVEFERYFLVCPDDIATDIPVKVYLGDIVSVQFWGDDVNQGKDYEVISVDGVHIYDFDDNVESFRGLCKEHYNYIIGEVTEIKEDNQVVVKVTSEYEEYKFGKQVIIKYENVIFWDYDLEEQEEIKLKEGDDVCIEFWCDEVVSDNEMDVIEIKNIYTKNRNNYCD